MVQKFFGKVLKVWTKAEEQKLVSLYWEGMHIDEIAKRLHRSRCAVTHRQHRLNIKGRKRVETKETKAKARDRLNELRKKD